jgi:hypothetical protein
MTAYFILSHRFQARHGDDNFSESEWTDGRTDITGDRRSHHRGRGILGALAAGGLIAAAANVFNRGRRDSVSEHATEEVISHHDHGHGGSRYSHTGSQSSYTDEKVDEGRRHTWRDRLLAGAGIAAVVGLARNLMNRRRQEESVISGESHSQYSGPPYTESRTDVSRMEEGRPPRTPGSERVHRTDRTEEVVEGVPVAAASPSRRSRLQQRQRRSGQSIYSEDTQSWASPGRDKRKNHTVRNSIAAMGIGAYLMNRFGRRRREEQRVNEIRQRDEEAERAQRRNSLGRGGRYTGDGRQHRRTSSYSESDVTPPIRGSTPALSRHHLGRGGAAAAGAVAGATAAEALGGHRHSRTHLAESIHEDSQHNLAPPPPRPGALHHDSSGSESFYNSQDDRHGYSRGRGRHHGAGAAATAGAAGLAAGAAGAALAEHHRRRSSVNSPPLSLKMHTTDTNGRQRVTLRRLSPAEAAAEREAARRRERRPGRAGSVSSIGGGAGPAGAGSGDEHWRRVEARERAEAADLAAGGPASGDARHNIPAGSIPPPPPALHSSSPPYDLPPPPPIPGSVTGGGSAAYETGGSAAGSRADSNRRRRRAERAKAEQARSEGRGTRVDFT